MKQCQAREDYVHSYLACKESVICTVCQKDVCRFCIVPMEKTVCDNGESEAMEEKYNSDSDLHDSQRTAEMSNTTQTGVCVNKVSW